MNKKRKQKRRSTTAFDARAMSTRADALRNSDPKIPDYGRLALRPGAEDYKKCKSAEIRGGNCSKKETQKYTGDKLLGIATMHKSNAVPVTKDSDMAKDTARMRRN